MTYHNTTKLSGRELVREERKSMSVEKKVLQFFRANPSRDFTPFEVWTALNIPNPVTSVRRAMTNLTLYDKELVQLDKKRPGEYGSGNYCWKLKFNTKLF